MNGTYANSQFQNHAVSDQSRNMHSATASTQEYSNSTAMANVTNSSTESPHNEIPPDEVGWYFVEQYYTTMSKSPEKLYVCQHYLTASLPLVQFADFDSSSTTSALSSSPAPSPSSSRSLLVRRYVRLSSSNNP